MDLHGSWFSRFIPPGAQPPAGQLSLARIADPAQEQYASSLSVLYREEEWIRLSHENVRHTNSLHSDFHA